MTAVLAVLAVLAASGPQLDVTGWAGQLLSLGGYGLLLTLLLTRRVVTRGEYDQAVHTSEEWRTAYEAERDARGAADERADTSVQQGSTTIDILQALQVHVEREEVRRQVESERRQPEGGESQ